jgi:hypothetical protein
LNNARTGLRFQNYDFAKNANKTNPPTHSLQYKERFAPLAKTKNAAKSWQKRKKSSRANCQRGMKRGPISEHGNECALHDSYKRQSQRELIISLLQLFAKMELSRARISGVPSGHALTKPKRFRP